MRFAILVLLATGCPAAPVDTGDGCDDGAGAGPGVVQTCAAGPAAEVTWFDEFSGFKAALDEFNVVNFDCVDTSGSAPVAVAGDEWSESHGVRLDGNGEGQYVDDVFGWPEDYVAHSAPNMFAPGPVRGVSDPDATNPLTIATFAGDGCVSGFGAFFLDADYPTVAASVLELKDASGAVLDRRDDFSSGDGGAVFRGGIARDGGGLALPVVAAVHVVNGDVWPEQDCCEGVVLDDLVFGR
jgi:hypothetical protein